MARSAKEIAQAVAETEELLDNLDPKDPDLVVDRDLADLRAIGAAIYAVEAAETSLVYAVASARQAGRSWTDVASILGVSRQAARQRFGSKIDVTWPNAAVEAQSDRSAAEAS